ncbi:MAG: DUF86 domain-containing protein [Quinella sp. 1Q7]|nr:DUF86 domain-containing protein [Quinella sp. 1Q7]
MRGRNADLQRLFHIVKWCRKLQIIGDEVQTYERFIAKENYRLVELSAFYIGQIGEHVRNLSADMKAEISDIPWQQINAMRNRLIHNYDEVRTDMVWGVITDDAPILAERCLEVLRTENSNVDAELREELAEEGVI